MTSTRGSWGTSCSKSGGRIPILGFKCDSGGAGKPVARPAASEPGSGAASLVDSVRCASVQLFAEVLEVLARGFAAAGQGRYPPGPAAVATWPAELCGQSPPASGLHPGAQPPDFRAAVPRLSRDVTPSLVTSVLFTRASPTGRPAGTHLVSDRAACGGRKRRRSSTQACRREVAATPHHAGAAARLRAVGRVIHP